MAQNRIKYVQGSDGIYTETVEADVNTLTAQPVALDASEDFRLIVADGLSADDVAERLQQLVSQLADGQTIRTAATS